MDNKLKAKYYQLYNYQQLSDFDDNSLFILFRSDFIIEGTQSFYNIPRLVSYWPKENLIKLYNPCTKRIATATILTKKLVLKILTSKSFNYYQTNYYIFLKCFIIKKTELIYFDTKVINKNIEKKKQEKAEQKTIKSL